MLFAKNYYDAILVKFMPIKNRYLNIINAGDSLNYINNNYLKEGISSLDFLCGVPCSVGGAIFMNAGAYNQSMSDIIEYVYCFDINDEKFKVLDTKQCEFSYRKSCFFYSNMCILGAKIRLEYLDILTLKRLHEKRLKLRKEKLPLEYPSLGSIFKNPEGNKAGELIEKSGLKGLKISGSMISEKHANVIVKFDECKGEDIIRLIEIIKEEIYMKYKINLEEEIIVFK